VPSRIALCGRELAEVEFSTAVITPGTTTTEDVNFWLKEAAWVGSWASAQDPPRRSYYR
jgi:hypothetical protein